MPLSIRETKQLIQEQEAAHRTAIENLMRDHRQSLELLHESRNSITNMLLVSKIDAFLKGKR